MKPEPRPLEAKVARRFAPFAAIGILALATTVLPPQPADWTLVWIAAVLTVLIMAAGIFTPWSRLARWTYLVPPLAYFGVVALLREASDGSVSGYSPLVLLPVVWIALNLGRREVAVGIAAGAAVIVVPLVVGHSESYSVADWRRALLWTAVAAIVGFSVESLMRSKRAQTRAAREHERTIAAIADVTRALAADADAREHICRATIEIAGARFAAIWEPDGPGELTLTGRAGTDPGITRFRLAEDTSGTVRAFASAERFLVPDAVGNPNLPQDAVQSAGLVSMLFEPIVRSGTTLGVLGVGWAHRVTDVDRRTLQAVELLAIEAAVAIERADFLAKLSDLAETDGLTGLPNRRSWDATIRSAVGYATRTRRPLCVAIVDLDHFKRFNDVHGHQAGDRLLKASASAWRTALRQTDTLARYGGEEFGVVLPGCSADVAEVVLERLRELTPEGQTCSVGLAEWSPGESDADLVARADEALYEAKRAGRDALVVHA
ncbi:MAG TPA: sensor domain-containing diguanylate cyclase [Gaiellaceae bacterium]|nr:sensor domain-containing diguanylate cyclase [Gaiellaceae bacterium]